MSRLSSLLLLMLLVACRGSDTVNAPQGENIPLRHAERLKMVRDGQATYVTIINPWDTTKVLHRYALLPDTAMLPAELPDDMTVVRTPLRHAAVYTSVHAALLDELGCITQIGGVCDAAYIANTNVHERIAAGLITDYGSGLNPTLELIMDTQPDALMPSPFENAGYGRIEKLGIPIIECADYMETTPLGRAEWMRFYGLLFGCEQKADSLFLAIEQRYLSLRQECEARFSDKRRPRVMCDMLTASTWYVPGGNSTMGRLIADAGGDYVFAHLNESGSVALSFESVLDRAHDADVWIIKYNSPHDLTYRSLAADNSGYTRFAPYTAKRIYGCNTACKPFFEEASFHPDLVLQNLADIFAGTLVTQAPYYEPIPDNSSINPR